MRAPLDTAIRLKEREVLRIEDGECLEVTCLRGDLWLTQDSDPEDTVIHQGESFILDRPGLALVSALLGPAVLVVQPGRLEPRRRRADPQARALCAAM